MARSRKGTIFAVLTTDPQIVEKVGSEEVVVLLLPKNVAVFLEQEIAEAMTYKSTDVKHPFNFRARLYRAIVNLFTSPPGTEVNDRALLVDR